MPDPITRRAALAGLTASAVTLLGTAGTARADVGFDDSPWAGGNAGGNAGNAGGDLGIADDPRAAAVAYAGFRVVRAVPGTPSVPEVTLPAGYSLVPGANYNVAS